ncbi:poly(ADP-ribose) glycohydrolase isoform X2 [Sphaeramia orbicularis]|uniref:poly(ADP-ribose) glycohydrolase isoform X2 n=1 Tax=Sphaeramia orbicularis TaxID=375764 RepID=UPI0011811B0F|nr:poly(ADP-ribose) glycohydrolase-like isoform X2 [Sphaeramia orbicularis]XP_030004756.1 poly(ADP-ribose) glycohydrolase-like isoform X2 [Sphaeramia orbicularis]
MSKQSDHGKRNDSSQMKALLSPGDSKSCPKENTEKHDKQRTNTCEASFSSSSSSSSSSRCVQGGGSGQVESEWRRHREDVTVSLQDLKRLPQCNIRLGHLAFSRTHTVLIDVDIYNCERQLRAQDGRDIWQSNFVKMPCSMSSVINKTGFTMKQTERKLRWTVIAKQLAKLAKKPSATVEDVEEAIMKYNPKYKGQWSFDALSSFVKCIPKTENYFSPLFPKIAALALNLPGYIKKAIPLLQRGHTASITMSQVQIACLLANAFFCTFPHRNTSGPNAEYHNYPSINFTSLFGNWSERKKEKLRAIMHYFNVVTNDDTKPTGLVTFERRFLKNTDIPNWRGSQELMPKLYVTSHGTIENDGTGMLQVDFASHWIGGGVLSSGLVQEEILFLMNPELIVSRLFTEKLGDNECLIITGSQQFSIYSGFSDSFEWAGPHADHLKRDEWARLQRQILAIDALHFRHRGEQYNMIKVTRELNKAYCGFKGHGHDEPDIATGKWGCGAFNGDPQLKALIQLMAAAKAKRGMALFTFGDRKLEEDLQQIYSLLVQKEVTVGKLYELLEDYCSDVHRQRGSHMELFDFIGNTVGGHRSLL